MAPTFYNLEQENNYIYGDRPESGPNKAISADDKIFQANKDSPLLMWATIKFVDFEQALYTAIENKIDVISAQPFIYNERDYDPMKAHPMRKMSPEIVFSTNAGTHTIPAGLKIFYDQLQEIGDTAAIKERLASPDGFSITCEDTDEGAGFSVKARESEELSIAEIWWKMGGLPVGLQISRSNILLATSPMAWS